MNYDLEDRTKDFCVAVIKLLKIIKRDEINNNLISQLSRSATSVGANYHEANGASSKKDFRNKIFICRKEIQESKFWIEIIAEVDSKNKNKLRILWKEAHELTLIFNKITTTLNERGKS